PGPATPAGAVAVAPRTLAIARTSPLVTSSTTAMPLLAPVAFTWSSSEYSACHCRSSSRVSTTSVPRCASTFVRWVFGMSWPRGLDREILVLAAARELQLPDARRQRAESEDQQRAAHA